MSDSPHGLNPRPLPQSGLAAAFTLVELLVVLAIIAILFALALPAFNAIQGSYNLSAASQAISAQLGLARQSALANSHPVQVRFYQLPDYNVATPTVFRAMQCFLQGDSATTPITKPYFFPVPIRVFTGIATGPSGANEISNLLSITGTGCGITAIASGDASVTSNPLPPPYGTNYQYSFFRFRPNGQTDLTTANGTLALLTIASENAKIVTGILPPNYVTLQINVYTGAVTVYRP